MSIPNDNDEIVISGEQRPVTTYEIQMPKYRRAALLAAMTFIPGGRAINRYPSFRRPALKTSLQRGQRRCMSCKGNGCHECDGVGWISGDRYNPHKESNPLESSARRVL